MALADPLVDVRIATWLVMPDCGDLTDSPSRVTMKRGENRWNLQGLLTQRAGKDSVDSTLNVLRTVSGVTTTLLVMAVESEAVLMVAL